MASGSPSCQVGCKSWVEIAKEVAVAWFAGPVGDELIGVAFEQWDIPLQGHAEPGVFRAGYTQVADIEDLQLNAGLVSKSVEPGRDLLNRMARNDGEVLELVRTVGDYSGHRLTLAGKCGGGWLRMRSAEGAEQDNHGDDPPKHDQGVELDPTCFEIF